MARGQFLQKHIDGALSRRFCGKLVALDSSCQITFDLRSVERRALSQFYTQMSHCAVAPAPCAPPRRLNPRCKQSCGSFRAGIFRGHPRYGKNSEPFLRGLADGAASHAVATALKSRPGEEQIGLRIGNMGKQFLGGRVRLFGEISCRRKILSRRLLHDRPMPVAEHGPDLPDRVLLPRADCAFFFAADLEKIDSGNELFEFAHAYLPQLV